MLSRDMKFIVPHISVYTQAVLTKLDGFVLNAWYNKFIHIDRILKIILLVNNNLKKNLKADLVSYKETYKTNKI